MRSVGAHFVFWTEINFLRSCILCENDNLSVLPGLVFFLRNGEWMSKPAAGMVVVILFVSNGLAAWETKRYERTAQ